MPKLGPFYIVHDDGSIGTFARDRTLIEDTTIPKNTILVDSFEEATMLSELVHMSHALKGVLHPKRLISDLVKRKDSTLPGVLTGDGEQLDKLRAFVTHWVTQAVDAALDRYGKEYCERVRKSLAQLGTKRDISGDGISGTGQTLDEEVTFYGHGGRPLL